MICKKVSMFRCDFVVAVASTKPVDCIRQRNSHTGSWLQPLYGWTGAAGLRIHGSNLAKYPLHI